MVKDIQEIIDSKPANLAAKITNYIISVRHEAIRFGENYARTSKVQQIVYSGIAGTSPIFQVNIDFKLFCYVVNIFVIIFGRIENARKNISDFYFLAVIKAYDAVISNSSYCGINFGIVESDNSDFHFNFPFCYNNDYTDTVFIGFIAKS
jgi:hypothetical protein